MNPTQPPAKFTFDVKVIQVDIPIFYEGCDEVYLITIRSFLIMIDEYDIFNSEHMQKLINQFRRCLAGYALNTWNAV